MYFSNIHPQKRQQRAEINNNNYIDVNLLQDKLIAYITKNWFVDLPTNILNFCNQEDLDVGNIKSIIPKPVLKELELIGVEKGILKRNKQTKKILFH